MPRDYLHNHSEFYDLIRIVARDLSIDPALVEKDYWIMHCLYGLQKLGFAFEMKGGTSLSKGFGIIDRFSEDIDIRIEPPADRQIKTGRNQNTPAQIQSRRDFYDWLAAAIRIDGIIDVQRDTAFDDERYRSGGIRLNYKSTTERVAGVKDGVLLEVGFDDIAPNVAKDISSWAYDYAASRVEIIDNRAIAVACYNPGYTFVEKLQAVSTKFRQQQETGAFPINFMRHYYDLHHLLKQQEVQVFIGTDAYYAHKERRFRQADNPNIATNQAFVMSDPKVRAAYAKAYSETGALYYREKPSFEEILKALSLWAEQL